MPTLPRPAFGAGREQRHFGPGGVLGKRVGGFHLQHAAAQFRGDPGRGLIAERKEDPGAKRLDQGAPGLRSRQDRAQRGDGLGGQDGDAAALPAQGKGLFISGRIVLADRREGLVLVADEDCRPEVVIGPALHLGRPAQKRLHPGVFEQHPNGARKGRIGPGGHVQGQHLARLDQLGQRGQSVAQPGNRSTGRRVRRIFFPSAASCRT